MTGPHLFRVFLGPMGLLCAMNWQRSWVCLYIFIMENAAILKSRYKSLRGSIIKTSTLHRALHASE